MTPDKYGTPDQQTRFNNFWLTPLKAIHAEGHCLHCNLLNIRTLKTASCQQFMGYRAALDAAQQLLETLQQAGQGESIC